MMKINKLQFQTKHVAEILGVEVKKVKKLTEGHGGVWYKMGDRWMIHRVDLAKVLESMGKNSKLICSKDLWLWERS